MTRNYTGDVAVIFTYNFDKDSSVTLFDDENNAKEYLKASYEEELRIETEENEWDVYADHTEDWTYAQITHHGYNYDDICEYRLTGNVIKEGN